MLKMLRPIDCDDSKIIDLLIKHGININQINKEGGNIKTIKLLLSCDINVNNNPKLLNFYMKIMIVNMIILF